MSLSSTKDEDFLNLVSDWIVDNNEIFIVIRYSHSAGAKDYLFLDSFVKFKSLINDLPEMADVIVFRTRQLPVRGIANISLFEQALAEIPADTEFLLLSLDPNSLQTLDAITGESQAELKSSFQAFAGSFVAVGKIPEFWMDDNENMQSALIPCADNSVGVGVY